MKKTRTMRKVLLAVFSAMLLVCVTIGATVAYLTSQDTVTNTFTVGKVAITLDEADVDEDTNYADNVVIDGETRDKANSYKLMPGHTYTKDPTIHVAGDSEDCYLFVKVENGISVIEDSTNAIADQMKVNGWTPIAEGSNIYVYQTTVSGSSADKDIEVFGSFTIADEVTNDILKDGYEGKTVVVTAYAVQADGFEDETPAGIWTAAFGSDSGD